VNRSLSGSGFSVKGHHIIDPRTGKPADGKLAAWSLCSSATLADSLSTAFIVMAPEEVEAYCKSHPDTSAMLIMPDKKVLTFGKW
jgi:thiamine biosynthesis lipoprotein